MRKMFVLFSLLAAASFSVPAFALPGELVAVERHCGNPSGESKEISQVTNTMQRTLIYNDLLLHFQPQEGGWSFTTGWHGHFPITRNELENRLPCFRDAMNEVANSAPKNALIAADPAIAQQTGTPISADAFGIPHFWLIIILVATLIVFILVPSAAARRRKKAAQEAEIERNFRKPDLEAAVPIPPNKHIDPDLYQ